MKITLIEWLVVMWLATVDKSCDTISFAKLRSYNVNLTAQIITISMRKWIMFSIYRPLSFNLQRFFQELEISVDKATSAYDNVIIMGDINIDTSCTTAAGYTKIEDLMDIFGFENLIKYKTCHASTKGSDPLLISP